MPDIAMGDTGVRRSIVAELSALYPGLYNNANIALGSTHQHSGVGGYLEDLLPQITALGYVNQTPDPPDGVSLNGGRRGWARDYLATYHHKP